MAIDISNVVAGSATPDEIARQRRARLAKARTTPPVAGPGSTGLGIGGNLGVRYKPRDVFSSIHTPSSTFAPSTSSYADQIFNNVDTMLFRDRLAPARALYESNFKAFKFSPSDMQSMIRAGLMVYGKGGDMKYRRVSSSANLPALNSFLRDNYVQVGDKWKRQNKKLMISTPTIQYLTQGGDKVLRNPRTAGYEYERITHGTGENKRVDYVGMADTFAKDQEQQTLFESKIAGKVAKEGGSALWNKIMTGKYTVQDVQNLRQYMYSPNGSYGDAQERFIQETLLNNQGASPADLIRQRDAENIQNLMAENQKAREKDQATFNKDVADMVDTHFNSNFTADQQMANLISVIQGGQGAYVPTYVIERIMRDGAGSYVPDNKVTGGKRFVPAPMRGFTEAQKAALMDALVSANEAGYTIPAGLRPYIDPMIKDLTGGKASSEDNTALNNAVYKAATSNSMLAPFVATGAALVGLGKTDFGAKTISDWQKMSELSYLQPTQNPNAPEWAANWLKGAARFGTGFMPGMYYMASDPVGTGKAIAKDYWATYSNWDNFKAKIANDPLAVTLDALSLVDGIGLIAKGGQIASATARLGRAGEVVKAYDGIHAGQEWKLFDPAYNPEILDAPKPGSEFPETGQGISRLEYAALMRQVANGDEYARMRLEALLPKGTNASNSLMMPTFMDRAAAFFEPRYQFVTRTDGNRTMVDKARQEVLQDQIEGTTFRFSGSPISRGFQRVLFTAQTRGGLMSGRIANLPLLGFNYRFDKASSTSHLSINEAVRREMGMLNLYHKAIDEMKLTDVEQQMIMNEVAGGAYSPAVYSAIIRRKLIEDAKGMNPDTRTFLEEELKRMEDPERLAQFADAKVAMIEGKSPRGIQLAKAYTTMLMLLEKQNRLLSAFDSPAAIQAALTAYQPLTRAAKLDPEDIMSELGDAANNLAMFNPNWHFAEQMKVYAEHFVFEDGKFRPITKADTEHMAMLDQMKQDMEYLRQDHGFRNLGGHPFFIVDDIIRDSKGEPMLIRGRRLRIEGNIGEDLNMERLPLIDERPLVIPASAIVPVEGVGKGVMTMPRADAEVALHVGAVNALNKIFPNVRDFVDKITDRSVNTAETFKDRANRGIVVATGIQDYHLRVQFKAHAAYLQRRVAEGWQEFFDKTAVPVRVGEFDPNTMVAIKTAKFFEDKATAEAYAEKYVKDGAVEKGTVEEVTINGKTMYRTNMRYFDVMKATVQEQRKTQLFDVADFEKDYLARIEQITNLDPNEIILTVPRSTYNRFKASQLAVDANLKEMFFPTGKKAYGLFTSLFKVFALAMNPHFIPQSLIGSSMMMGLATPELFPKTMAGLMQQAARRGKAKLTKEESDAFSHHVDDFEYMTRTSPHEFENVYHQDAADSFAGKLGDSRLAKWTIYNGYTVVFAMESNMRVALMRAAALKYPGFKSLMNSKIVRDRAAQGLPDLGLETLSPFQAAFEMLRDPASPLHDPNFMHEIRFTADGALGNYRDFSHTEKAVRNYLIPFYAWQRHSALFTKRFFQERPLAANAAYHLGNYGFEKVVAAGGVPDWLYETVPMPDKMREILQLDPMMNNRIGLGPINPFSTTTEALTTAASLFAGQGFVQSNRNIFDYTNPFINGIIAQTTGMDPRTGVPVQDPNAGFFQRTLGTFEGFPAISFVANTFRSYNDMNALRGMNSPEDIFVDPTDPNSKLSIPKDKLTTKFESGSRAGLFNFLPVSPFKVMSLNSEAVVAAYRKQMKQKGVALPEIAKDQTRLEKHTAALMNWKRKADWIQTYWMPAYGKQNPELAQRVMSELAKEFPELPQNYPSELYNQVMGGG